MRKILAMTLMATAIIALASGLVYGSCCPILHLPPAQVSMQAAYPVLYYYYRITLSNVPPGYGITNGQYPGWCVEECAVAPVRGILQVRTYSCFDVANPKQDAEWDKICYILNHKKGDQNEIQNAIWAFTEDSDPVLSPVAKALVNEANITGEGFVPAYGQVMAVVLCPEQDVQVTIIEVLVPLQIVIPEYPYGSALGAAVFVAALCVHRFKPNLLRLQKR